MHRWPLCLQVEDMIELCAPAARVFASARLALLALQMPAFERPAALPLGTSVWLQSPPCFCCSHCCSTERLGEAAHDVSCPMGQSVTLAQNWRT